jgi:hypothetical protein
MSTLTNYNVKVALDWTSPPTEDKAVIFDLSENKFVLGTIGSSGITVKRILHLLKLIVLLQ